MPLVGSGRTPFNRKEGALNATPDLLVQHNVARRWDRANSLVEISPLARNL